MNKGLSDGKRFNEQIRVIADPDDTKAITEAAQRIAELTDKKKGYILVETFIDESEQNFFLESKAE